MPFKIGQTVYSLSTLRLGMIEEIEITSQGQGDEYTIKIAHLDSENKNLIPDSYETLPGKSVTSDFHLVIRLLKEQVEEYQNAFFREKQANQKLLGGRVSTF